MRIGRTVLYLPPAGMTTGPLSQEEPGLRAVALAAVLLSAAMLAHLASAAASHQAEQPSATLRRCHRHVHHRLATDGPPSPASATSWCIHFAKNAAPHRSRSPPPPPPPPPPPEEIDPRYGEAKRLVPSGPNPLHN